MFNAPGRRSLAGRMAGFAAAIALPLTGVVTAATAENPALAAEAELERSFDRTFEERESVQVSPAAMLEAATVEAIVHEDPSEEAFELIGTGVASYYGQRFAGRRTANGEVFDPADLTAAHRTLPFGTKVKVTNNRNGRWVVVRINDRGPFHGNRVIDLSEEAARQIGLIRHGKGQVELARLDS